MDTHNLCILWSHWCQSRPFLSFESLWKTYFCTAILLSYILCKRKCAVSLSSLQNEAKIWMWTDAKKTNNIILKSSIFRC